MRINFRDFHQITKRFASNKNSFSSLLLIEKLLFSIFKFSLKIFLFSFLNRNAISDVNGLEVAMKLRSWSENLENDEIFEREKWPPMTKR